jgi:hypothetical protein
LSVDERSVAFLVRCGVDREKPLAQVL